MIHALILTTPSKGLLATPETTDMSALKKSLTLILPALPRERIWILTTQTERDSLAAQLVESVESPNVLGEAQPKGSGVSLAFASIHLAARDPNPVLLFLTPTPITEDADSFIQTIGVGLKTLKQNDGFVLLGTKNPSPVHASFEKPTSSLQPCHISSIKNLDSPQPPQENSLGLLPIVVVRARLYMDALKEKFPPLYESFIKLYSAFGSREEERIYYETYQNARMTLIEEVMADRDDLWLVEGRL